MIGDAQGLHYVGAYRATDKIRSFDVAHQHYSGPGMMCFEVKPGISRKILECIDGQIASGIKTDARKDLLAHMREKETITGLMDHVDYEYQRDVHNNIISDTFLELALVYMKRCFPGEVNSSKQLRIDSSWYVYMNAGDYHTPHHHSGSHVSGAIYLDIDSSSINQESNPEGCIRWFVPNPGYDAGAGHGVCSDIFQAWYMPESNVSWVWPGRLIHLTCPFKGNSVRKMISFNCSVI